MQRGTKEPLDEGERGEKSQKKSEKADLKLSIHNIKIMASGPITSWQIDGETVRDFYFLGLQNHSRW